MALLWALWTPQSLLILGLDHNFIQHISDCELRRLPFQVSISELRCKSSKRLKQINYLFLEWKHRPSPIAFFYHVGWLHDFGICQLYYVGPSNKLETPCILCIHFSRTWKIGWSHTLLTFVHESLFIICSQKTMFIPVSFHENSINNYTSLKISTLFTIFLLYKPALFIIHTTGISFFLFFEFLLVKVR